MQNIEIKVRVDDMSPLRQRVVAAGARAVWTRRQHDTFFHVPHGYLKLRRAEPVAGEHSGDEDRAELIAYARAPGTDPRPSDYDIAPVTEPDRLVTALGRSLGVRGEVRKTRELWLWQHTRIHLDQVEDLGHFLELEAVAREITVDQARLEADRMIEALDLGRYPSLDRPYLELLEAEAARPY